MLHQFHYKIGFQYFEICTLKSHFKKLTHQNIFTSLVNIKIYFIYHSSVQNAYIVKLVYLVFHISYLGHLSLQIYNLIILFEYLNSRYHSCIFNYSIFYIFQLFFHQLLIFNCIFGHSYIF
jgi:hypothetical protein